MNKFSLYGVLHFYKKGFCFVSLFLLFIAVIGLVGNGNQPAEGQAAPLNPAFVAYMHRLQAGAPLVQVTPEGYYLGYIPSPVDRSHLDQLPGQPPPERLGLPDTYDLRTLGRVTPVRDQGNCGSCWAHATMASAESSLLTDAAGTWDLSENNLKECHYFTWGPCDGGNADISTGYFARRVGPLVEADDPYRDCVTGCSSGSPRKYVREVWYLPQSAVKDAIMTYGALYTAFYWHSSYYNDAADTYYYTGGASSNHAVAIVGWEDNKVVLGAPGNGAWILKNSWGTAFGEAGYFYMSYNDTYAAAYPTLFHDARDPASTVYQYDPLGWVGSLGYPESLTPTVAWGANVFTTTQPGYLDRVAFYTTDNNTSYNISIRSENLEGTDLATKSGSATYAGYHTVDLTTPIWLAKATPFAVVIKFTNPPFSYYPVAVEYAYPGYSDAATASPGQSYMSDDGTVGSWYDVTGWDSTANVCIHAIFQGSASVFRVNDLGNVYSDSSFYGVGIGTGSADVAEWVPVSESVEPGDVLELDPSRPGHYRKARSKCSTLVAGVVSTKPGVILGSSSPTLDLGPRTSDSALLALLGIVPVKVTDENGPIQPGDLLVSSSIPGYAMRWDPESGVPCNFVGKALEALAGKRGVILVLLMAH